MQFDGAKETISFRVSAPDEPGINDRWQPVPGDIKLPEHADKLHTK